MEFPCSQSDEAEDTRPSRIRSWPIGRCYDTIGIPGLAKLLPEGVEARGNSRNPQKLRLNWPKAWVK
ncbi:hypothetical protein NXS19_007741, partial [Fusarium pseudograminearum]